MPRPQSVKDSLVDLSRSAILIALVLALSPAWSVGQESRRQRRGDSAKEGEKPAGEKPAVASSAADKSSSEKSKGDRGERNRRRENVAATNVPVEQQLQRTSEGRIRFNFQGQPWLEVLKWLANSSKLTLDWQDLPEDNLNLSTQSSYSLDEARDLLNMHLAARGFTLLRRGEVLALIKLDKLNPALVPRVDPDELVSRDAHEIVRVSFPLDWLVAEESVKEFEPMKSPFGKLTPMKATNRLEALDTVENLRQIHELLSREQSAPSEDRLVVEFKLKHVRAEDIIDKLNTLVGAHANLLRPQDRARMQMMRAHGGNDDNDRNREQNNKQPPQRQEQEVHLVINEKENSILANAPPDKLAVVRQAVQALDVRSAANTQFSDAVTRMKIYRTKAIDPEAMQDMIEGLVETGKLAKNTQVQSDDNSSTLIVYASPVDHLAIANLVSQIDDDGRDVRIITLRQLTPEYALQAIQSLLKGEQQASGDSGGFSRRERRRGGGGGSSSGDDQFRIEADLERRRLLLWASDEEYEEVQALLAKLGEGAQSTSTRGNIRVLNVPSGASQQALENLKQIWPNLRTNPLHIDDAERSRVRESARQPSSRKSAQSEAPPNRTAKQGDEESSEIPGTLQRIGSGQLGSGQLSSGQLSSGTPVTFAVAALSGDESDTPAAEPGIADKPPATPESSDAARDRLEPQSATDAPSINITEGPGGQLIITSQDVEALDAVENLIQQILPKKSDYEVFRLKHASPYSVQLTLEQIFGMNQGLYGRSSSLSASTAPAILFISDIDTGTLLVQGATADQLQKIEGLIKLYDQPESLEAEQQRKTEIYEVKYSHAEAVAEVVKEVYRDLLSSNDKTFTRERKEGEGSSRDLGYGVNYGSKIPQFKGLLSIGVEDKSNTLIVSAPAFLIEDILGLIRDVDQRTASHKVKVVQLSGVGPQTLRGVLSQIPGVTTSGGGTGRSQTGVGTSSNPPSNSAGDQGRSSFGSRGNFNERSRFGGDGPRGEGPRGGGPRGGDQGGSSFNRRGGGRD